MEILIDALAASPNRAPLLLRTLFENDVLDLDPVARMDSRVVEVFILLDDPGIVAGLTNLQVDVEIGE